SLTLLIQSADKIDSNTTTDGSTASVAASQHYLWRSLLCHSVTTLPMALAAVSQRHHITYGARCCVTASQHYLWPSLLCHSVTTLPMALAAVSQRHNTTYGARCCVTALDARTLTASFVRWHTCPSSVSRTHSAKQTRASPFHHPAAKRVENLCVSRD